MNPFRSMYTRWRHRTTGETLVTVAIKPLSEPIRGGSQTMVLPIKKGADVHPFDWMDEAGFLRTYEPLGAV